MLQSRSYCLTLAFSLSILLLAATAATAKVTVGEHVVSDIATSHPYISSGADEAMLTWSDEIFFPGATYIAPHFSRFQLAEGDYLVVRSPDHLQKWVYRGLGKNNLGLNPGGFFGVHLRGDRIILELYTAGDSSDWGFDLDYYGRGYSEIEIEDFWAAGLGEKMNLPYPPSLRNESICTGDDTVEAKCLMVSEPDVYDKGRAVARLLLNGGSWCTGWLVGDEGHVMTNEHCIGSQSQLNDIDFEFMAEGADCSTNCASSLACPGTIEASGGTMIQFDAPLDYALVLPDTTIGGSTNLPATYGFMRLRDTGAVLNEQIYIAQHPAGWGKRFAFESTYPDGDGDLFVRARSLTEPTCSGGVPEVGYWGDTQGGSSGSPVLAYSDHRVVALHHCRGSAFCTSGNPGTDDPNRGVPIQDIIADLGPNLPNGAVCDPPDAPSALSATGNGDNQIDLTWTQPIEGATLYKVLRAQGTCPQASYDEIATISTNSYSDTTVSGSVDYAYQVVTFDSATGCTSAPTNCDDAQTTGACTLAPTFAGLTGTTNAGTASCAINLAWGAGAQQCGAAVAYNVYRSETSGFTPGPGNLIASCVAGASYDDITADYGVEYFYVVRAEDDSGNGSGPCAGGNEDGNSVEMSAVATGPDTVFFTDDMESGSGAWATAAGPTNTGTNPWTIVDTASNSPTHSWFTSDEPVVKDQWLTTEAIALPAAPAQLTFSHWYDTEPTWDGGVLEYSTDGTTFQDIGGRFLQNGYPSALSSSANPLSGRDAFHGDSGGFIESEVDLSDFSDGNIWLRWRMGCDATVSGQGWWVDDVVVSFGSACTAGPEIFEDGFESGNTNSWSATSP